MVAKAGSRKSAPPENQLSARLNFLSRFDIAAEAPA
jgi:hypothetical protein